jgi:phytol kinase
VTDPQLVADMVIALLSYFYILAMIYLSEKTENVLGWSRKTSRKLMHILIGNFPFIIIFFGNGIFPVIIAASFVGVTFLASPYSPFDGWKQRLKSLQDTTVGGHPLGLILYAVSYTLLAALFFDRPYVIAAGILPMAYGDSLAALVGGRYGKMSFRFFAQKTAEGSFTLFLASLISVFCGLLFYSLFFSFSLSEIFLVSIGVALLATIVEAVSPFGLDNLTVPLFCALAAYLLMV